MTYRRLETWFWSCVLALLPFLLWLFVHQIASASVRIQRTAAPELAFFALTLCALTLPELQAGSVRLNTRVRFYRLFHASMIVTIFSAALYGAILLGEIRNDAALVAGTYYWSLSFAVAAFFLGTVAQVRLAREGHNANI